MQVLKVRMSDVVFKPFTPQGEAWGFEFPLSCESLHWGQLHGRLCLSLSCPFWCGIFFFFFLGPHPQHMEVPSGYRYQSKPVGLGSNRSCSSASAIATWDPSHVCDLPWQCQILNPLSGARDGTCILVDTRWICYHWAPKGTSDVDFFLVYSMGRSHSASLGFLSEEVVPCVAGDLLCP